MRFAGLLALSLLTTVACRGDRDGAPAANATDPAVADTAATAAPAQSAHAALDQEAPAETHEAGTSGNHRDQPDWVPAEHRSGGTRWRDCGVYVDGEPVGFLWYGELSRDLEPYWETVIKNLPYKPGEKRRTFTEKAQRFRLADYLESVGVDLSRVKEVQLLGGAQHAIVISGRDLRKWRKKIMFKFGGETNGKPLPLLPAGLAVNTSFDKLRAVTVYIDKQPPVVTVNDEPWMNGELVEGVAYFGAPLRGGVHVYKNGRLAVFLKRRQLGELAHLAISETETERTWRLYDFLAAHDVDTADLAEVELIYDEERVARISGDGLTALTFSAAAQAGGQILVGPERTPVQAIMLYTDKAPVETARAEPR